MRGGLRSVLWLRLTVIFQHRETKMDTMTIKHPIIETSEPIPTTTKSRTSSTIADGAVTLQNPDAGPFALADIPQANHAALALHGLRQLLMNANNPNKTFADLVAGKTPGKSPAKPKELDHRRMAIAFANTDMAAKEQQLKANDPAWKMLLDDAEQRAAGLTGAEVKAEHKRLAVMIHYAKLVGED